MTNDFGGFNFFFILFVCFVTIPQQVTDTDDSDKKKIKTEDASDEIASQPNQTAAVNEQESPQNPPQELISTENGQNTSLANDSESVAPTSLPPTVITTQRHRMITTTGQIR